MPTKNPAPKAREVDGKPRRANRCTELLIFGWHMGFATGKAEGKAEAVLGVLKHRQVPVSAAVRRRVRASRDLPELQRWFARAFIVDSAEGLFASSSAWRKRHSTVVAGHSTRTGARVRARVDLRLVSP